MMTSRFRSGAQATDAELVSESLLGDRDAFGRIVARYQSLVCSLAYSATGCLGHSEDLAQETFITAWRHLRHLREPGKLRAWLCGIARNHINNFLRREGREPLRPAEPLETAQDLATCEPQPSQQAISREEEALLWRTLERIPETYREPLVLFYREHQSIERVAEQLDLSEDAVKQRLSRGRKLLREQVLAFVEGALERTNPGKAFTLGVLAALPLLATSASAATVATAAKGSATASSATLVTVVNAVLGPVVGLLGAYFGVRASLNSARTPRERQFVIRQVKLLAVWMVLLNVAVAAYILAALNLWAAHPRLFAVLGVSIPLLLAGWLLAMALRYKRQYRQILDEEKQLHPEQFPEELPVPTSGASQYRSPWTFLGLPFVHVNLGARAGGKMARAVGWIAIGDRAYGVLFAAGAVAVGGVSFGGVAVGVIALGAASVGLLAVGALAVGGLAMGGWAVGLVAVGGVATAWIGAEGGLAVAREFAAGGKALAHHANDATAREFFAQYPWMDFTRAATRNWWDVLWWLLMLLVVWQALVGWRVVRNRKSRGQRTKPRASNLGNSLLCPALLVTALLDAGCGKPSATMPALSSTALPNGVRVVTVYFPASTNVSIFTFLPMGLASDAPGQAQWSHLIEHLAIRSTIPTDSPQANGETLPDHMRLDFYGDIGNWKEGLAHHRRWLEGMPFTQASLAAEKPRVIAECDSTARNFATHKFAVAAWSHGFRHGKKHVALKSDVTRAGLSDVQRLRDERLVVSNQVTVCIVSGLESKQVLAEVEKELGALRLAGEPTSASKALPGNLDLTWDLNARHLMLTWPIPDFQQEDHAALMVAAQFLNMALTSDSQLAGRTGMTFAGADLTTPEGSLFYVSASLRLGANFDDVRKTILAHVARLASGARGLSQSTLIGRQISFALTEVRSAELIKTQAPPGVSVAMIEGNVGLQLGMHEYRYGAHRAVLAKQLAAVTADKVQQALRAHLTQKKPKLCTLTGATAPATGN